MSTLVKKEAYNIEPKNFGELMKYAEMIANSDMAPKDYKRNPGNVLVAIQMGAELGLKPMQALQNIAVINGRPSIWGDAALALVQSHPEYDGIKEEGDETKATCTIKRKGEEPHTVTFTEEDAKKAKLLDKDGPWKQYRKRMLQMRARGFALRDKFADALKGLILAEEARDYPTEEKIKYVNQDKGAEGLKAMLNIPEPEGKEIEKPEEKPENVNIDTGEIIDIEAIKQQIEQAKNNAELTDAAQKISSAGDAISKQDKDELKKLYAARRDALKAIEAGND